MAIKLKMLYRKIEEEGGNNNDDVEGGDFKIANDQSGFNGDRAFCYIYFS